MVRIVGIGGSLRPDSYTQLALQVAAQRVEALGAEVEILICDNCSYRFVLAPKSIQSIQMSSGYSDTVSQSMD